MTALIATIALLYALDILDGYSTIEAVNKGYIEGNKFLVWLYGTNKPGAKQEYGYSSVVVGVQGAIAIILGIHHPSWILPMMGILGAEAVGHFVASIINFKHAGA